MVAVADLVVIVPSRGRPQAVEPLARAFGCTSTAETRLLFAVDESDPTAHSYLAAAVGAGAHVTLCPTSSMVSALNHAAVSLDPTPFAVGFLGDDHCPRTVGWDQRYLDALTELGSGIVYGDDLLQGKNLPTQCAMTSDIIAALGWMAPPTLTHLAVDNWWLELGQRAGCISYLPDVVVEHRHPVAGKAAWDEGYRRVNDSSMYHRDLTELGRLRVTELPRAVAAVKHLRGDA